MKTACASTIEHVPRGWGEWHGLKGNSVYYNYTISNNGDRRPVVASAVRRPSSCLPRACVVVCRVAAPPRVPHDAS